MEPDLPSSGLLTAKCTLCVVFWSQLRKRIGASVAKYRNHANIVNIEHVMKGFLNNIATCPYCDLIDEFIRLISTACGVWPSVTLIYVPD